MPSKSFEDLVVAAERDPALAAALRQACTLGELVAIGAGRSFAFNEAEARAYLMQLPPREDHESVLAALVDGTTAHEGAPRRTQQLEYELQDILIMSY